MKSFIETIKNKPSILIGLIAIILILMLSTTPTSNITEQKDATLVRHTETNVGAWGQVLGNQKLTKVSIAFSFEVEPIVLRLNYQTDVSKFNEYMMFHPQLQNLNWNVIREGEFSLYQKEVNYDSVSEFLDNPTGVVYADPQIGLKYQDKEFNFIDEEINLDEADYILTTFIPVPQKHSTYYFERIIDTSDAYIAEGQMYWLVLAPNASKDRPFSLGEYQIEYL